MLWDALCLIADTLIFFSYFTLGYIIFSVNGFIIFLVLKIKEASIFQALSSRGAIFNLFFIGLTYQPRVTSSRLAEFPDVGFLIVLPRQNQHGFFPILWVSAQLSSFLSCTGFLMQSQCQLVALIPGQIEFCSESPFLPIIVQGVTNVFFQQFQCFRFLIEIFDPYRHNICVG